MIIIFILDRLDILLDEPSAYFYIAGFEFIFVETPLISLLIYLARVWIGA